MTPPPGRASEAIRHAAEVLADLPEPWPSSSLGDIEASVASTDQRLVVIDDDPTGTQTVHDVPVLMDWSAETLRSELESSPVLYISTNSRALDQAAAIALSRDLGASLQSIADDLGCRLVVASRSDSTLRGHYPAETDALAEVLDGPLDATVLVPYFHAGGRLTIDDTHFVRDGETLVPAAQTEFARDATFSFTNSWLPAWVAEKTGGRVDPADVICIGLDLLRRRGPDAVADRLLELPAGGDRVIVVNAADDRDLEVFVSGLIAAEQQGRRYLYRTAASFVRVRAGIPERPPLTQDELGARTGIGGLLVVGSHVDKTTRQLDRVRAETDAAMIELDVAAVLDPPRSDKAINTATEQLDRSISEGIDAVLYTSRALVTADSPEGSLALSTRVSEAVCRVVRDLSVTPRFVIAKGGITSSTLATDALGVRRAWVLGQLQPGVPVWRLGDETTMPGAAYVVYPGNVGDEDGLVAALATMGT